MASKVKVNEFTTTSGSGSVAFAKGGADMTGDMSVNGTLSLDSLGGAITVKSYTQAGKPSNPLIGTTIWNTSTNRIEIWNGNLWTRMDEPGGQFPTNGLVVHLDATDTNSYNGSGTVWSRWFGKKAAEIILNFEQRSAFYNIPFKKIPFYNGYPWFVPIAIEYFKFQDWWINSRE